MSTNPVVNEAIREGLSREVLLQGIHAKDQNILHRFFDVCRHLTDDGYWRDKGLKENSAPHHHSNSCQNADGVHIEVETQKKKTGLFAVVDSIGDAFELFNVRWVGGRN